MEEEDKLGLDTGKPVSWEQPYPAESRKVPQPPTPKSLPKNGPGKVLVPNSDVSMAGSSQPSQEAKVVRQALVQRDVNSVSGQQHQRNGVKRIRVEHSQEGGGDNVEKQESLARTGKKNRIERRQSGSTQQKTRHKLVDLTEAPPESIGIASMSDLRALMATCRRSQE